MIVTVNVEDGSTLADNLITSHQVDYMSSAHSSWTAEAVENDQEHIISSSNKIGSITPLF